MVPLTRAGVRCARSFGLVSRSVRVAFSNRAVGAHRNVFRIGSNVLTIGRTCRSSTVGRCTNIRIAAAMGSRMRNISSCMFGGAVFIGTIHPRGRVGCNAMSLVPGRNALTLSCTAGARVISLGIHGFRSRINNHSIITNSGCS